MATTIQVKRGTTAQVAAVTPSSGEPLWDTTLKELSVGDGATAGGVKINPASRTTAIEFVIDGGGATITAGQKGHLEITFDCVIERMTILGNQSGSIVVDIWKDTYANFPPVDADSITSATPPTISAGVKAQDSTLTSWTTTINAGDILAFNVDSITDIQRVTVSLKVRKT